MGLFEVARWKQSLTANVCLSCAVNGMTIHALKAPACFTSNSSDTDLPGLEEWQRRKTLLFDFLLPRCGSLPSCPTRLPLFYLRLLNWHSSVPLIKLKPAPALWPPSEICSSKHFMLEILRGSGSSRYVTGRELSVLRPADVFLLFRFYLVTFQHRGN